MNARLLPDWLEHGVESSLRASPDDAPPPRRRRPSRLSGTLRFFFFFAPWRGSGGHSTPIVVLTPADSEAIAVGSVPKQKRVDDLEKFYESESEDDDERKKGARMMRMRMG